MSLELEIINPLDYKDWDERLCSKQDYSFFHSSSWAKVLCESYNYKPLYFTLGNNRSFSVLVPIMEVNSFLTGRRGVSLPFSDYCELILDQGFDVREVLKYIIDYGKKARWKYIELKPGKKMHEGVQPSERFYTHALPLVQEEGRIFEKFRESTRRNIKKAINEGVSVQRFNSLASVKEYYRLHCMTRKEHGLPPQPYHFFKKVYECIISRNLGFVALASYKNKIIAGAIYFHFGDKVIYKYGASDKEYQHLRANNLVMWEAIRLYCKAGFKNFCFGRTEFNNPGLRQFKNGWGTKEAIIRYYKYDLIRDAFITDINDMIAVYHRVFKKTPVSVLKIVGSLLYKHIG